MAGNGSIGVREVPRLMAVLLCASFTLAQADGDSLIGQWYTEKCQASFDFYRHGQEYNARMTPLEKPDLIDSNNPVDSLKTRQLKGQTTIYGLIYDPKKRRWVNGRVYNPEDGRTYSCYCWLRYGGTKLYFKGYIGIGVLGGSQIWAREKCKKKQ